MSRLLQFWNRGIHFIRRKIRSAIQIPFLFWYDNLSNSKKLAALLSNENNLLDNLNDFDKKNWTQRIIEVKRSPDNQFITRHPKAGTFINDKLIMHNGLKIDPFSYYNTGAIKMLIDNKGVHEPQEERVFQEVINSMDPKKQTTMIELGAYWSFYSLWFKSKHPNSICYMIEPDLKNMLFGKRNFRLNNMKGIFVNSFVGGENNKAKEMITIDHFCKIKNISFIDILHADIQGDELNMLNGCASMLSASKIAYLFISTHSKELHYGCMDLLKNKYGYTVVASADQEESYSWDGVLIMKLPGYKGLESVDISKRGVS